MKGQVNSDCVDGGSDEKSKFNHKDISINPFQDWPENVGEGVRLAKGGEKKV